MSIRRFPGFSSAGPASPADSCFPSLLGSPVLATSCSAPLFGNRNGTYAVVWRPAGPFRKTAATREAGCPGTDLGLTYDQSETVIDQLYTTSFAAMNYWIAYKATGEASYLEDYFRVADYLVRIQVDSPNERIDGGWMRGFDYSLWEYYGSNADQSWTAYCMETGWTNAILDIALALYLLDDTFYEPRPVAAPERQSERS